MLRSFLLLLSNNTRIKSKTAAREKIGRYSSNADVGATPKETAKGESKRIAEFRKKLRETTNITDLGDQSLMQHEHEDPLPPFPNNTNPTTGEVGGPKGPEPTRYGDWERKGRVSDF